VVGESIQILHHGSLVPDEDPYLVRNLLLDVRQNSLIFGQDRQDGILKVTEHDIWVAWKITSDLPYDMALLLER
jgi:hypothetical protein